MDNNHMEENPAPLWEENYEPNVAEPSLASLGALRATAKSPFNQLAKGKIPKGVGNTVMSYLSGIKPLVGNTNRPRAHLEEQPKIQQKIQRRLEEEYRRNERRRIVAAQPQEALRGNLGYEVQQEAISMGVRAPPPREMSDEELMEMFMGPNWREKQAAKDAKKAAKKAGKAGKASSRKNRKTRKNRKSRKTLRN